MAPNCASCLSTGTIYRPQPLPTDLVPKNGSSSIFSPLTVAPDLGNVAITSSVHETLFFRYLLGACHLSATASFLVSSLSSSLPLSHMSADHVCSSYLLCLPI